MTEKIAPWWRSFVGKRRKAAKESAAVLEQDLQSQASAGPTQHPSADSDKRYTSTKNAAKEAKHSLPSEETYDDSAVQPTFNELSNRRNLTVSRSGRFKEKRKKRVSLPNKNEDDGKTATAKSADGQSKH